MSLTFPLSAADFADRLRIASVEFTLDVHQEMSGTGGGSVLYADLAPSRYHAELTTVPLRHSDAEGIKALVYSLQGGLNSFYLYNPAKAYPVSDPDGSIFGASTPVVGTITDRYNVAFTGFPAGYVLTRGDFLQITFGSRRYLGQFVEDATADGSGDVAAVRVTPALPASVATSDAVSVIKPAGKFKLVPNSLRPSMTSLNFQQLSWSADQVY